MTAQEIFDKVYRHLLAQGARSTEGAICAYRTRTGLKCAVGVLIPDEMYDPEIEGIGVTAGLSTLQAVSGPRKLVAALDAAGIQPEHYILLDQLQNVHDVCLPGHWPADLAQVAEKFNLTVPETK